MFHENMLYYNRDFNKFEVFLTLDEQGFNVTTTSTEVVSLATKQQDANLEVRKQQTRISEMAKWSL
jgi:hypothetical protein